jgi:Uma2 family endonuclease
MSLETPIYALDDLDYPSSDGRPMADSTLQFDWIVTVKEGCAVLFQDEPNVFVAGDLLWYPVEGRRDLCAAPDTMVVFGRPKGHRQSYIQHREGGIPPQVVFEVRSHNNTPEDMQRKWEFYNRYGVEEYYVYDPFTGGLEGWLRQGDTLLPILEMRGWVSPRLRVRFELEGIRLVLIRPDGRRFATYEEIYQGRQAAERETEAERQEREAAEQRAEAERRAREAAEQRAEAEHREREAAEQRTELERQERAAAERRAESERRQREAAEQREEAGRREREAAVERIAELEALLRDARGARGNS